MWMWIRDRKSMNNHSMIQFRKNTLYTLYLIAFVVITACQTSHEDDWLPLFNGEDLDNWGLYLSVPDSSLEVPNWPKDSLGYYQEPLRDKDLLEVYRIDTLDGNPVLRVSGAVIGNLYTKSTYQNYHLKAQFRWGEKKWSWMEGRPRDGGILYHYNRIEGKGIRHELQIHEGDVGSYWAKHTYVDIPGGYITELPESIRTAQPYLKDIVPTLGDTLLQFSASKSSHKFRGSSDWQICLANPYNENAVGEWNTLEILAYENHSVHIVNGQINMVLLNASYEENGSLKPMKNGSIQIQSEGAELYFKEIKLKSLHEIPKDLYELLENQ